MFCVLNRFLMMDVVFRISFFDVSLKYFGLGLWFYFYFGCRVEVEKLLICFMLGMVLLVLIGIG